MKKIILIALTLFSVSTFSYVENTIHGYANCMSCHISPNGGGILTDYGRSLSSELMSTWKTKNFQKPFYGLVNNTKNLKWGGHLRTIQTRRDNNNIKQGSSFLMQNNVEAALYIQDFVAVGTVGTQEGPDGFEDKGEFLSERHYVLWNIDQSTRVKFGKYRQAYGINDPNHTRFNKSRLGFGSNSETYGFEVGKFYETGEAILSTSLGRIDIPEEPTVEKNIAAQYTHYLLDSRARITGNILLGESEQERRALYGFNGIIPIMKNNFVRFQWDYEVSRSLISTADDRKIHGLYGHIIAGRKFYRGITGYVVYEHMQTDLDQTRDSLTTSPGLGFQWLPVPHIEIQFEHQYRTAYRTKDNPNHISFLMLHLYH